MPSSVLWMRILSDFPSRFWFFTSETSNSCGFRDASRMETGYTRVLSLSLVSFALGHAPVVASSQAVTGRSWRTETVLILLVYSRALNTCWSSCRRRFRCTAANGIKDTAVKLGLVEDISVSPGLEGPMLSSRCALAQ